MKPVHLLDVNNKKLLPEGRKDYVMYYSNCVGTVNGNYGAYYSSNNGAYYNSNAMAGNGAYYSTAVAANNGTYYGAGNGSNYYYGNNNAAGNTAYYSTAAVNNGAYYGNANGTYYGAGNENNYGTKNNTMINYSSAAVIRCPHCGKEIYKDLLECPECHGPITQNIEQTIDNIYEERNKQEKKSLIKSSIIGAAIFAAIILSAPASEFTGIGDRILGLLVGLLIGPCFAYGVSVVFRKVKTMALWGFFMFPVFGWLIGMGFVIWAGCMSGIVLTPLAFIKLICKKPLVSREKVIKELSE